ncbi:MAG: DUF3343 domain-containing protein [Eubacteriaceae bacterium]
MTYFVLAFANTHSAIMTEKHLKSFGKITLMPTLREISSGCGISIRIEPDAYPDIIVGLKNLSIDPKMVDLYEITPEKIKKLDLFTSVL